MIILLKDISDSDTILMVSDASGLPQDNGVIQIASEILTYTTIFMNTLYGCTRGIRSTSAASHLAGSEIFFIDSFTPASSGGSGIVNNGNIMELAFYATTGTTVSGQSGLLFDPNTNTFTLNDSDLVLDYPDNQSHTILIGRTGDSQLSISSSNFSIQHTTFDVDINNVTILKFNSEAIDGAVNTGIATFSGSENKPGYAFLDSYISGMWYSLNSVNFSVDGINTAVFDLNSNDGETRFMLYDVTADILQRVSIGDADSGGTGFRVLRIPN